MKSTLQPVNILYVIQSGKPGGAEISTLSLIKKLDRSKFNPIVLVPPGSIVLSELNKLGVETIGFSLPKIKPSNPIQLVQGFFRFLLTCHRISQIVRKENIRIVHSVSNKRSAAFSIASARFAGTPVVWTIRIMVKDRYIDNFLLFWATKIVAISQAVRNFYDQNNRYNGKFVQIYNAVDISDFEIDPTARRSLRKKWGLGTQDFVVAIAARLSPEKGHKYFIETAAKVLAKEPQIKFVVIGDINFYDNPEYYRSLQELCKNLGVENTINFLGFEKDIPFFMSCIDVLTMCCEIESFGRVAIEAMAMGKPVISFDVGGPREIIQHNKTGFLVPPKDITSLTEAILRLYQDIELRTEMGKRGKQRVKDFFAIERHVAGYQQVYEELL